MCRGDTISSPLLATLSPSMKHTIPCRLCPHLTVITSHKLNTDTRVTCNTRYTMGIVFLTTPTHLSPVSTPPHHLQAGCQLSQLPSPFQTSQSLPDQITSQSKHVRDVYNAHKDPVARSNPHQPDDRVIVEKTYRVSTAITEMSITTSASHMITPMALLHSDTTTRTGSCTRFEPFPVFFIFMPFRQHPFEVGLATSDFHGSALR